ncbi:MAG TPA: hypothetical protein VK721_08725 [Solirubrobacteraceae bacterium]|jgi:hypothetical protein|nr:hypothetical protein [Solirubrobacteraceae bacterium]
MAEESNDSAADSAPAKGEEANESEPVIIRDDPIRTSALQRGRWWIKYQDERRLAYHARAGWLLGFAGVIAALAGAQAQNVFEGAEALGGTDRPWAAGLLGGAAVAVAVAGVLAVLVLRPIESQEIDPDFLRKSLKDESLAKMESEEIELLTEILNEDAPQNSKRLKLLNVGFIALLVSLVLLVAQVLVFLSRSVESPCSGSRQAAVRRLASTSVAREGSALRLDAVAGSARLAIATGSSSTSIGQRVLRLQREEEHLRSVDRQLRERVRGLEKAEQPPAIQKTGAGRPCKK